MSRGRLAIRGVSGAIAVVFLVSCGAPYIVETNGVHFDKTEFDAGNQRIHVSGRCKSIFYVVQEVSTTKHGGDILVQVRLMPKRKSTMRRGMSGTFEVLLPVESDIQRVLFGT